MTRQLVGGAAAVLLAASLGGCISLLPKSDPAQLYRFGRTPGTTLTAAPATTRTAVALNAVEFPQTARGDRLLAVTGAEVAYLANSRWASPAEVLFSEALERAFEERARAVRLTGRRELEPAPLLLDVDVRTFEARYDSGPKAAPTVAVALRARLLRMPDRLPVAERSIETRAAAADNRVGAIVEAFDAATGEALTELVGWTDATAASPRS